MFHRLCSKYQINGQHYFVRTVTCDVCHGDGGVWEKDGEIVASEEKGATVAQCPSCYGDGKVREHVEDHGPDISDDG